VKKAFLKVVLSLLGLGVYSLACWVWWAGDGGIGSVCVAEGMWLLLALAVVRLWYVRWQERVVMMIAVGLTVWGWAPVAAAFEPHPLWLVGLRVALPLMVSVLVGLYIGDRGAWVAGLVFVLGYVGLLPIVVWRTHYEDFNVWLADLIVFSALMSGAGWFGSRLRRRRAPSA